MSAETLQGIEDAILAHHRDTTDPDEKPERARAVITAWVIAYEISDVVDVEGVSVIGYANTYASSDSSPNLIAHLASWTADEVAMSIDGDAAD